jgi:hypothetical protein
MDWKEGELREVQLGRPRRLPNSKELTTAFTTFEVPAPYDRIVSQLIAEDMFVDTYYSHESHRRRTYARRTLDAFGQELVEFKKTGDPVVGFRSKVLTPILQRQVEGVLDTYTPTVCTALNATKTQPSIQDATQFYLRYDPVDPVFIRSYRRNLLYLPEPRWHLGLVMGVASISKEAAVKHYLMVREHHNTIMKALEVMGHHEVDENNVPLLSHVEVAAIIREGLADFFDEELQRVVGNTPIAHI